MKIELPLENWADLLPFVPRRQLAKLLLQINNCRFITILHYVLYECGQITVSELRILAPKERSAITGPIVEVHRVGWPILQTKLPEEPIPANIRNFDNIRLSYFDSSVLAFLRKLHGQSLLSNVNLEIAPEFPKEILHRVLGQLLPLIGINSISFFDKNLLAEMQNARAGTNATDEFWQLLTTMLAQTRILSIKACGSLTNDCYCNWLYDPLEDGRPRMLSLFLPEGDAMPFIDRIKKDFSMAKHPSTFFIRLTSNFQCENISLENWQTNEKLVIRKLYGAFLIARYPAGANAKWIQSNGQEILEFVHVSYDRTIYLDHMLRRMTLV